MAELAKLDFKYPSTSLVNTIYSKDDGPKWTSTQQYSTSADASSTPLAITGTPTSGKRIVIDDLLISTNTALTLTIRTSTPTTFAIIHVQASSPVQLTFRNGLSAPAIDVAAQILTSASGTICVTCSYHSE